MTTLNPALLYGGNAGEALDYYRSIFDDSEVLDETRWQAGGPGPEGELIAATLRIGNQTFTLINGYDAGFTDSISFQVSCEDQAEVDYFWDALTKDGEESQCGWLRDKFTMAWQIVPVQMPSFLGDPDPARAQAAMAAMMGMKKLVIADFEAAMDAVSA